VKQENAPLTVDYDRQAKDQMTAFVNIFFLSLSGRISKKLWVKGVQETFINYSQSQKKQIKLSPNLSSQFPFEKSQKLIGQ